MRQAAQQIRAASGATRVRRAARTITLQRSRHTPCAVAESPSGVASANHFHAALGTSNAQRESVTAHGVCLLRRGVTLQRSRPAPNGPPAKPGARGRRGITLLELLVVMLILLMVTAAAIPIIAPAMQNRQMREATRLVTSFMGAAKARAVQTGRPVGVVIERFNGQPFALQMAQVEVPPPYSGDTMQSRLRADTFTVTGQVTGAVNNGSGQIRITVDPQLPFPVDETLRVSVTGVQGTIEANGTWDISPVSLTQIDLKNSSFANAFSGNGTFTIRCWPCVTEMPAVDAWQNMIRYGDRVKLDCRGREYVLSSVPPTMMPNGVDPRAGQNITTLPPGNNTDGYWFLLDQSNSPGGEFPIGYANFGAPYQVFRQPVRTSSPPLQLPEGIVFDLTVSGVGSGKYDTLLNYAALNIGDTPSLPSVRFDPLIIFSPSGRVELASNNLGHVTRITDPIYLLLGRRELMHDVVAKSNDSDIVFQNLSAVPPAASPGDRMPPAQNFWITIGPSSGQASVSEVAPHVQDYRDTLGLSLGNYQNVINLALWGVDPTGNVVGIGARTYARESQSLGGR